jgi:hypothetical protein
LFVASVLLFATALSAQEITREPDGTVSVQASNVQLGHLLRALAELGSLEKLVLKGDVDTRRVTLTLAGLTIREALVQVMVIARVDYVLGGARLVVGDSESGSDHSSTLDPVISGRFRESPQQARTFLRKTEATFDTAAAAAPRADAGSAVLEAQLRNANLQEALAVPVLPLAPGSVVNLPFPSPDGTTPLSEIMPSHQPPQALPFPETVRRLPPGGVPLTTDRKVQELINTLSPSREPK